MRAESQRQKARARHVDREERETGKEARRQLLWAARPALGRLDKPLTLRDGRAPFYLPKFLFHARIGKQILATDFLGSGSLANQYGNVRIEIALVRFSSWHNSLFQIWFKFATPMGKKKEQSLTERLAALISRVGEKPEPTFAYIKGELVDCRTLAESLEEGAVIRDAEAKIAILEAELGDLKIETKELQMEVETFRAERKKQEEQERRKDLPPEQLDILRRLPSKHGGLGLTMLQIWREINGRLDETEIHVDKLEKAGLIEWHMEADGEKFWRRSMLGNELVVAKRLAGEEGEEEQGEEPPELTQMETFVLMALAHGNGSPEYIEQYIAMELPTLGPPITSPDMILLLLLRLREKKLVSDADKPSDGGPSEWKLLRAGTRLLTSRRLI